MSVKSLLTQLIFPPRCIACGKLLAVTEHEPPCFCAECQKGWRREMLLQCPDCFFEYSKCRCMPYALKRAGCSRYIKLFPYDDTERTRVSHNVILGMKRRLRARAFSVVAGEMALSLTDALDEPSVDKEVETVIGFLPRRRGTQKQTGFDQARQLGLALAERTGLRFLCVLARGRDKREQKKLTVRERQQNIKGAFSLMADPRGQRVVLVDDVVTTGASAAEAVRLLRRAGAAEVWVLSVGYTVRKHKNKKD